MKKTVAIILARGGSKRIPNKNIKNFHGKPIINYSIEAAKKSGCFEQIIVSTDSKKIAEISKEAGAEVPFFRSKKNSSDEATTSQALLEVLRVLNYQYESFCCIYPTAPLIRFENLIKANGVLSSNDGIDGVIPVSKFSYPVQRSLVKKDNLIKMKYKSWKDTRSQDLESYYHDAGQFYFLDTQRFLQCKNLWSLNISPLFLPESEVQDIDYEIDWEIAEIKYKKMKY